MGVIIGISVNTLVIAGMIVWLSRGGGAQWVNTLNATSLSTCISLFVIMETAGAVMGIFIWAHVTGHPEPLDKSLGYLGIWFGFLGTHLLANSGTQIAKRATDGTYVEKKGEAQAKIEAAKVTGVVPGSAPMASKPSHRRASRHAALASHAATRTSSEEPKP